MQPTFKYSQMKCHLASLKKKFWKANRSGKYEELVSGNLAPLSFVTEIYTKKKIKNLFMLSVRISSYGCTREVWRARKMRKICTRT